MRGKKYTGKRMVASDCPFDLFISTYRNSSSLPQNVILSKRAIQFFKKHADQITINGREIKFEWEKFGEDLEYPELRAKVVKERKTA